MPVILELAEIKGILKSCVKYKIMVNKFDTENEVMFGEDEIVRKLNSGEPLTEVEQKYIDLCKQQEKQKNDIVLHEALIDIENLKKIDPQDE